MAKVRMQREDRASGISQAVAEEVVKAVLSKLGVTSVNLTSKDGTKWALGVNDDGTLFTTIPDVAAT